MIVTGLLRRASASLPDVLFPIQTNSMSTHNVIVYACNMHAVF